MFRYLRGFGIKPIGRLKMRSFTVKFLALFSHIILLLFKSNYILLFFNKDCIELHSKFLKYICFVQMLVKLKRTIDLKCFLIRKKNIRPNVILM